MLFHFFHKKTYPGTVKKGEFIPFDQAAIKKYSRFPMVQLPSKPDTTALERMIETRTSATEFDQSSLPLESISKVLFGAKMKKDLRSEMPDIGTMHRNYPSGGGLFPLEIYVFPMCVDGLSAFSYHYRPDTHALEELYPLSPEQVKLTITDTYNHGASALILISAVWHRSSVKYGELAYRLALLEAGHLMQNILLIATQEQIAARPIVGLSHNTIEKLLHFEGLNESIVYGAVIGCEKK